MRRKEQGVAAEQDLSVFNDSKVEFGAAAWSWVLQSWMPGVPQASSLISNLSCQSQECSLQPLKY